MPRAAACVPQRFCASALSSPARGHGVTGSFAGEAVALGPGLQQRSRSPRSPPAAAPGAVLCEADPDLALTVGAISVRGGLKYGYLMREGGGRPLRAAALPEEVPGIQGPRAPAARRGLFSAAGKGVRSRGGRRQLPRASRLPGQRGTARRPFRPLCLPFISLQANRDSLEKC